MEPLAKFQEVSSAFDHPITIWLTALAVGMLIVSPIVIFAMDKAGRLSPEMRKELYSRHRSWVVLAVLIVGPILLGSGWTVVAITGLSLACFTEFARVTGLFRDKPVTIVVIAGILAEHFTVFDHWYGFFVALIPLVVAAIAITALIRDRPEGYLQRVALGTLGFMLFGSGLAHLAYFSNDPLFRPIILMIIFSVQLNDVFAFLSGKTFGGPHFAPRTSPNKTLGGAAGALVLTTAFATLLGTQVFKGTALSDVWLLIAFGIMLSSLGQLGDLMLSAIKRDLGLKDTGNLIPGHGGLLDRFDSLLLVSPAAFHFVHYCVGVGVNQPTHVLSG